MKGPNCGYFTVDYPIEMIEMAEIDKLLEDYALKSGLESAVITGPSLKHRQYTVWRSYSILKCGNYRKHGIVGWIQGRLCQFLCWYHREAIARELKTHGYTTIVDNPAALRILKGASKG